MYYIAEICQRPKKHGPLYWEKPPGLYPRYSHIFLLLFLLSWIRVCWWFVCVYSSRRRLFFAHFFPDVTDASRSSVPFITLWLFRSQQMRPPLIAPHPLFFLLPPPPDFLPLTCFLFGRHAGQTEVHVGLPFARNASDWSFQEQAA